MLLFSATSIILFLLFLSLKTPCPFLCLPFTSSELLRPIQEENLRGYINERFNETAVLSTIHSLNRNRHLRSNAIANIFLIRPPNGSAFGPRLKILARARYNKRGSGIWQRQGEGSDRRRWRETERRGERERERRASREHLNETSLISPSVAFAGASRPPDTNERRRIPHADRFLRSRCGQFTGNRLL